MLRSHAPSRIPGAALLAVLPFIALLLPACDFTPPDVTGGGGEGTPSDVACDDFVADSVGEFSSTQGQDSWFYGYYEDPGMNLEFIEFTEFNGGFWSPDRNVWTEISNELAHPNGTNGNAGRLALEHWAVRRWVSHTAGQIQITGSIARDAANSSGNGVTGRILVDGEQIWSLDVPTGSIDATSIQASVEVSDGSTVDFAIDPRDRDDVSDLTVFTASIQCAPASE